MSALIEVLASHVEFLKVVERSPTILRTLVWRNNHRTVMNIVSNNFFDGATNDWLRDLLQEVGKHKCLNRAN